MIETVKLGCGLTKHRGGRKKTKGSGDQTMATLGPPTLSVATPIKPTSGGGATGSLRNKVSLGPGRSLMDWIRLGKTGQDLTGVGGQPIDVTTEELAKHCTDGDVWMALNGWILSTYILYTLV